MKELKKSLNTLRKNNNTFGWMLAVANVHETYSASLNERKEKIFLLDNQAAGKSNEEEELGLMGEKLVQNQQEAVSRLTALTGKQERIGRLFWEYERLKKEREELLNHLAAARHDLNECLVNEINRLR